MEYFYVGQRVPEWATGRDGCMMEYNNVGGLMLLYFLCTPTAKERNIFNLFDGFQIAFTPVRDIAPYDFAEVGYFCFKIGSMEWSDCPFSPNLLDAPVFTDIDPGCGYPLTAILIDATTGVIQGLRVVGLGYEFSKSFRTWCCKRLKSPISRNLVYNVIGVTTARYSTSELVERAWIKWEL